jgi:hypothetical protein
MKTEFLSETLVKRSLAGRERRRENNKKEKPIIETTGYKIFVVIFFLCFFYYGTYNALQINVTIWSRPRYTIGEFIGKSKSFRSTNPSLKYQYYYKGKKVEEFIVLSESQIKNNQINYKGGRYLVVFDSLHFRRSDLLYKCKELSDTITAPDTGWVIPPISWCDKRFQSYNNNLWYNQILLKTIEILNIEVKPKK